MINYAYAVTASAASIYVAYTTASTGTTMSFPLARAWRRGFNELWCHECENYVQFKIDESLDGKHVIPCPRCGHEHCRYVNDGEITERRWAQRNL